jgi:ribonuclease P protein subunit POP4
MIKLTPKTLKRHELIGLECKVVHASNPEIIGIEGTVIDESKNMITIECEKRIKIPKKDAIFQFELEESVTVDGKHIIGRPEDRVNKR